VAGIIPAITVFGVAKWLNKKLDIPVRVANKHVTSVQNLPSLILSILPIIVPLLMIGLASIVAAITGNVPDWIAFQGNKNIAMGTGAVLALYLWRKTQKLKSKDLWEGIAKPLEIAGIIILITSAGGAYGAMIKHSGIGDAISLTTAGFDVNYILLAWMIAAAMKIAQGSGTVSMIATAAIMTALIGPNEQLPYHPVYILLSIGFGSLFISWMNDSGFWVVARMSGFTEREALQTWTVLLGILALVGLFQVLLMSWILPLV
jgi:GntP family gluconate:H+ symporter